MIPTHQPLTVKDLNQIGVAGNARRVRGFHLDPLAARLAGDGQGRSFEAFFQVARNCVGGELRNHALGTNKGVKGKGGERRWRRKGQSANGRPSE
jgi:hypothetical protein